MKIKTQFVCQSCGHASAKWLGRCPGCEAWNSLVEEQIEPAGDQSLAGLGGSRAALGLADLGGYVPLEIETTENTDANSTTQPQHLRRLATGNGELDRVLGGGLVPDSFTLLGGDPGIGKSTLLLQMTSGLCAKQSDIRVLYVSGEESIDQIRARAHRLGVTSKNQIFLAAQTQLERVLADIKELKPQVVVMDSLQTFSTGYLQSAPGSVSQVREVAARLMMLAKTSGISVWLVGHVTKDGNIAGPKVVEHMVDTVLYFEGDGGQSYRLLRTVKNRFGSTRELGVFEMDGEGLREVTNPSALFLSERQKSVPGTAIAASLEGTRPILAELQALVASSSLAVPRRTAVGMDNARVALLAAILERHMEIPLAQRDLFFNVAGGLRLSEPACDLAAAAAIWSSSQKKSLPVDWVWIGEVGLTGEVRRVSQPDIRIKEAKKLGFKAVVIPKSILERCSKENGIKLIPIERIEDIGKLL